MRIGIACHAGLGGSGTLAVELARALDRRGHAVHLIASARPPRLAGQAGGITFHQAPTVAVPPASDPDDALALAETLVEVARAARLDLVHAHYALPHADAAILARERLRGERRLPVVTTLHGTDVTVLGHDPQLGRRVREVIGASDLVTAVSTHLAAQAPVRPDGPAIRVIPNFVDSDAFGPAAAPEALRARLGPRGERLLVHVSNFRPIKRVADCLAILERVRRQRPARLVLVGDGPDRDAVRRQAEQRGLAGAVVFEGEQARIADYLNLADVLLLPSQNEAFGLAALEAMSCAVPVVASRVGGLPEVVADGQSGWLLPVGDTDAMADVVLRLLADDKLARTIGQDGRRIAVERFPAERAVAAYLDAYREAVDRASPRALWPVPGSTIEPPLPSNQVPAAGSLSRSGSGALGPAATAAWAQARRPRVSPLGSLHGLAPALWPFREPEPLQRWRDTRVRALVRQAVAEVPFARDWLAGAGLRADDIESSADLTRIPPVDRRSLLDAGLERLVARGVRIERLLDRSTSGSMGERMIVKRTWIEDRILNAYLWRALREYGLKPRERVAVALFHTRLDPGDHSIVQRLIGLLGFRRARRFDALGDPEAAQAVTAFEPRALMGMTSALVRLIEDSGAASLTLRPRFVMAWGELLTGPLRQRLATLGAPVQDLYGSNEVGVVAWECPAGTGLYHVCDELVHVDLIDPEGQPVPEGAWGEVVVTNLHLRAMPFLRYRVGDLAQRGPARCPCGAPGTTLRAILGRTIDLFPIPGARPLHPWEILNAIRPHTGWVRQFQLVQEGPAALVLRVVVARPPAPEDRSRVESAARTALAGRATFRIERTAAIAPAPSGKCQPFVPYRAQAQAGEER